MSLGHQIPIEILLRIITLGLADPQHGKAFGAKCMQLARWIQPIVAPLLYHTVILKNYRQVESFSWTLWNGIYLFDENTVPSDIPAKFIHSVIIEDNKDETFNVTDGRVSWILDYFSRRGNTDDTTNINNTSIANDIRNRDSNLESGLKELYLPISSLLTTGYSRDYGALPIRFPPSLTLSYDSSWYPGYHVYIYITKLRFISTSVRLNSVSAFVRKHKELVPNLTHLALAVFDDAFSIHDVESIASEARDLHCVLVLAVPLPTGLFNDWESPDIRRDMLSIKVPKLIIWEEEEDNGALFRSYDSAMLWDVAERELADPGRQNESHWI